MKGLIVLMLFGILLFAGCTAYEAKKPVQNSSEIKNPVKTEQPVPAKVEDVIPAKNETVIIVDNPEDDGMKENLEILKQLEGLK